MLNADLQMVDTTIENKVSSSEFVKQQQQQKQQNSVTYHDKTASGSDMITLRPPQRKLNVRKRRPLNHPATGDDLWPPPPPMLLPTSATPQSPAQNKYVEFNICNESDFSLDALDAIPLDQLFDAGDNFNISDYISDF